MGLASDIRKKIDKKYRDLNELEEKRTAVKRSLTELNTQIREVTAAKDAYEEILKITPEDSTDERPEPKIRPGSTVALAREVLRKHGQPMHVSKLLEALGKQPTHENRVSLSGSLA